MSGGSGLALFVNDVLCRRCGDCVLDCPSRILERDGDDPPFIRSENEHRCLRCQHCMAVCPSGALSILGVRPEDGMPLAPDRLPSFDSMNLFVRGRRSVRQYRDENVDPALLGQLLSALSHAPTGVNRRELTFRLINDRKVMDRFRDRVLNAISAAARDGRLPDGPSYLRTAIDDPGRDVLFRGAPHAIIVSAPPDAPCPAEDVVLSLAYFELLAQSAGLGTVWWGMLKSVLETIPDLKAEIGLPAGHRYYGMLFGVPAVRYHRTVRRDGDAVVTTISLPE